MGRISIHTFNHKLYPFLEKKGLLFEKIPLYGHTVFYYQIIIVEYTAFF